MSEVRVVALYRYPVKGFSPEPLERAEIEAGGTMPYDRALAIENGPIGFDPAAPAYYPKARFLMLMRDERMAEFRTRFDDATGVFRIFRDGALQVEGSLLTAEGRAGLERWLAENFREELRGPPKILSAPGHSFSDVAAKVVHLVNLASVRALEERLGRSVDPLRFRPNVVIDGAPAFAELGWEEGEIRLPGLTLVGRSRTGRCAATNVDPQTGSPRHGDPAGARPALRPRRFRHLSRRANERIDRRRRCSVDGPGAGDRRVNEKAGETPALNLNRESGQSGLAVAASRPATRSSGVSASLATRGGLPRRRRGGDRRIVGVGECSGRGRRRHLDLRLAPPRRDRTPRSAARADRCRSGRSFRSGRSMRSARGGRSLRSNCCMRSLRSPCCDGRGGRSDRAGAPAAAGGRDRRCAAGRRYAAGRRWRLRAAEE